MPLTLVSFRVLNQDAVLSESLLALSARDNTEANRDAGGAKRGRAGLAKELMNCYV